MAAFYDWYFDPSEASRPVVDELVATTGAIIIGRGAFGPGDDAGGWDDTPYEVPHFVVTHRPPQPVPGRAVEFIFVPDGVRAAVELARQAAAATSRSVEAPTSPGNASPSIWWMRRSSMSCPCCSWTGSRCSTARARAGG